jgi:hypothetical protein
MTSGYSSNHCKCPRCDYTAEIANVWGDDAGDYGGFVLQCVACRNVFEDYVGRDVKRSSVRSGAKLLDRYIDTDRERVLRGCGLIDRH